MLPEVEVQSLKHWTTKDIPILYLVIKMIELSCFPNSLMHYPSTKKNDLLLIILYVVSVLIIEILFHEMLLYI